MKGSRTSSRSCAARRAVQPPLPGRRRGGSCAPTLDELTYETVTVWIEQPVYQSPSGIWVVIRWRPLPPAPAEADPD